MLLSKATYKDVYTFESETDSVSESETDSVSERETDSVSERETAEHSDRDTASSVDREKAVMKSSLSKSLCLRLYSLLSKSE